MSKNVKLVIDLSMGADASVILVLPKCSQVKFFILAMVFVPWSVIEVLSRFSVARFGSLTSGFRLASEILDSHRLRLSNDLMLDRYSQPWSVIPGWLHSLTSSFLSWLHAVKCCKATSEMFVFRRLATDRLVIFESALTVESPMEVLTS